MINKGNLFTNNAQLFLANAEKGASTDEDSISLYSFTAPSYTLFKHVSETQKSHSLIIWTNVETYNASYCHSYLEADQCCFPHAYGAQELWSF